MNNVILGKNTKRFGALILVLPVLFVLTACDWPFDSSDDAQTPEETSSGTEPLATGVQSVMSSGVEREFYLQLPDDYTDAGGFQPQAAADPKPLLIAFHGTGGSYTRWVGPNGYDLADVVGNDAIMVFPDALPDGADVKQWDFLTDDSPDPIFFEDLLMALDERGLNYDRSKVFLTGHSSGGGFAHELGCRYGDIIRGIAPSAGARLSGACVGGVGVLMSQGVNDVLVPIEVARGTRTFWTKYNALDAELSIPGAVEPCVDHSLLAPGSYDYPVVWCEHTEGSTDDFSGHAWASFTSEAVWQFFSTLSDLEPTVDEPPGGGNAAIIGNADTTISFTLNYPEEMNAPALGAIILNPADYINNPTCSIPSVILSINDWVPGVIIPGSSVTYNDVPLDFEATPFNVPVDFPSDWTMQIVIYVEGGGSLLPAVGKDLRAITTIRFEDKNTPITLTDPLDADVVMVDVCAPPP